MTPSLLIPIAAMLVILATVIVAAIDDSNTRP